MENPDSLWIKETQGWDLCKLYRDLSHTKNRELTSLQKAMLRAALCSVSLKQVTEALNREIKGLRTDLSTGLYRFIAMLLLEKRVTHEKRIFWQQIPRLLAIAGYTKVFLTSATEALELVSLPISNPQCIPASTIIETLECKRLTQTVRQSPQDVPLEVIHSLIQDANLAHQKGDYVTAIHLFRLVIEQDSRQVECLVAIAMCFDKLGRYTDSVAIALEALNVITDLNQISRLHYVLGSALHELAIHTLDEVILLQAINHYQKSTTRSEGPNVLGAWNSFELLVQFSRYKSSETQKFIRKAKLALHTFNALASNPSSNIEAYRVRIIHDAHHLPTECLDEWLCRELEQIFQGTNLST